jgi:tetratricopeptide (TPR) repeat protein
MFDSVLSKAGDGVLDRAELLAVLPPLQRDDAHLRHLLSELTSLLEDYLVCRHTLSDRSLRAMQLARSSTSMTSLFDTHVRRVRADLVSRPLSTDLGLTRYHLAWEELEQRTRSGQRAPGGSLAVIRELDSFYMRKRLQLACEAVNASHVLALPESMPDLSATLNSVPNDDLLGCCYRHAMLCMTGPEAESHFRSLRQMLAESGAQIEPNELRDLYQYVLNYSIRAINQGRLEHQSELLGTYRQLADSGALVVGGVISPWDFKNLITISIRVGETELAAGFIERFSSYLPDDRRQNAVLYNTAHLMYATGRHRQALTLLRQVDLDDPFYRLDARSILMKVYLAMDDQEALFHHLNAFTVFLKRDKQVSETQRKGYINTIKAVRVMAEHAYDPKRMMRLHLRISEMPQLADKGWLIKEVEGRM